MMPPIIVFVCEKFHQWVTLAGEDGFVLDDESLYCPECGHSTDSECLTLDPADFITISNMYNMVMTDDGYLVWMDKRLPRTSGCN